MEQTIYDFILNYKNGLLLTDLPTGYGKTYMATKLMHKYVTDNGSKKIFFLTTLLKNLPVNELRKVYIDAGNSEDFEKEVLVIKSNFDFVYDSLLSTEVPVKYQSESYKQLYNTLKTLHEFDSTDQNEFKRFLTKSIREDLEPNFRKYIKGIVKSEMPTSIVKRKELIRKNKQYQWIGKIYPTVFMSDYKIYLLTVNKFLVKNTPIIETSYDFLKSKIIEDAIFFIDEFDATKETIQQEIINRSLSNKGDYIELFIQIYHILQLHRFPESLMKLYHNKKEINKKYSFESLKEQAIEIYNDYKLMFNYKTASEYSDKTQSFLFNDGYYYTVLRNNIKYIRATFDPYEGVIQFYFENREDYYKNKTDTDINLYSLIRDINSFLMKFRIFVLNWSKYYMEDVNHSRNSNDDLLTLDNAMKTIYREFSLSEEQIFVLMNELINYNIHYKDNNKKIPDLSFYHSGLQYFEFKDSDAHLTRTIFNNIQVFDTPEKIINHLSHISNVIGISATSSIETVTGNFDLNYLKRELGDNFCVANNAVYNEIESDLKKLWEPYYDGRINTVVDVVGNKEPFNPSFESLERIFLDKDYAMKYYSLVSRKSKGDKYLFNRYCEILYLLNCFVNAKDIQSFLCLNMVLPKYKNDNFDLELFEQALIDLLEIKLDLDVENYEIVVLESFDFTKNKQLLSQKLRDFKKVFIFSTYKTIGAGQNLQYPIAELSPYILLSDSLSENDTRCKNKDLDAIFLGDITHVIPNVLDINNFDDKGMLKLFFQAESLYENNEINFKTLKQLIKQGFKSYSGQMDNSFATSAIKSSSSFRNHITKDIVQAVGRLCRTYVKNANIYIYITKNNINNLNPECLENIIVCPEVEAILLERRKYFTQQKQNINQINLHNAEKISTKGKIYIRKMLTKKWTPESMKLWKDIRETTLKYPTATEEEASVNEIIKNLYIRDILQRAQYYYTQADDFSSVEINFDNKEFLRKENNIISTVSVDDARLKELFNYPGLKHYFEQNGWATNFNSKDYILSPILFNNIYKGALGEVAGRFILEQELKVKLNEINDCDRFEFFDFEMGEGVYIDFKHWKLNYQVDRIKEKNKILNKLESIGGKCAFIINIYSEQEFDLAIQKDEKVIEVPYLIDREGNLNIVALKLIRRELGS